MIAGRLINWVHKCFVPCYVIVFISIISVIIFFIQTVINVSTIDARITRNEERLKTLEYKIEQDLAEDDSLSSEVVDEIQEWNEDVVYGQAMEANFWTGNFYGSEWVGFMTIDLQHLNE